MSRYSRKSSPPPKGSNEIAIVHAKRSSSHSSIKRTPSLKARLELLDKAIDFLWTHYGYKFNEYGELRGRDGGRFKWKGQQDYDKLGDVITEYIFRRLCVDFDIARYRLEKVELNDKKPSFYASADLKQPRPLLVLIHGVGAVRAGQWSRKLIINEGLDVGSMLPYVRQAEKLGWMVLLMNTNEFNNNGGYSTAHGLYVWENYVIPSRATKIYVVAHSMGGEVISSIMNSRQMAPDPRVRLVLLTDSWYNKRDHSSTKPPFVVNFVARNMEAKKDDSGIIKVYAGTTEHERTSHSAESMIFKLFEEDERQPFESDDEVLEILQEIGAASSSSLSHNQPLTTRL